MTTFSNDRATVARIHRPALERLVRSLPAILSGRLPDWKGIRAGFHARIGFSTIQLIAEDFETLGLGGMGAGGYKWAPNTPEYLAYGKGPKSSRMGTGRSPGHADKAGSGNLNQSQMRQWRQFYAQTLAFLARRGMPLEQAKPIAAGSAWKKMKGLGATTLLEEFGNRRDQVLFDRGTLARSLLPGTKSEGGGPDATYTPPDKQQIYETAPDKMVIGTRVKYANCHHNGKGRKHRPLWPQVFPPDWWQEILGAGVKGLMRIKQLAERGDL